MLHVNAETSAELAYALDYAGGNPDIIALEPTERTSPSCQKRA
jgi:hypothetical protein